MYNPPDLAPCRCCGDTPLLMRQRAGSHRRVYAFECIRCGIRARVRRSVREAAGAWNAAQKQQPACNHTSTTGHTPHWHQDDGQCMRLRNCDLCGTTLAELIECPAKQRALKIIKRLRSELADTRAMLAREGFERITIMEES